MPAIIFTADAGTDLLTCVGHGLLTGEGPAATRNIGGGLPAPLAAVTDYWVIRIDADHVKLATSSSNAMAGTAINLTTNGTGTNVLEIGIPYRRPRTYVAGTSQVKSADLNANFDAWPALHALLTAQAQSIWNGIQLAGALAVQGAATLTGGIANQVPLTLGAVAAANQHIVVSGSGDYKHGLKTCKVPIMAPAAPAASIQRVQMTTPSLGFNAPINELRIGDRILAIRVSVADSVTGPTTLRARLFSATAGIGYGAVPGAVSNTSDGSGSPQTLLISALTQTITSGVVYSVSVDNNGVGSASNTSIYDIEIDYDRPPP